MVERMDVEPTVVSPMAPPLAPPPTPLPTPPPTPQPTATTAIQEWQRGVVAVGGLIPIGGSGSTTVLGTGFIVDLPSGLVVTCAHVVLKIYQIYLSSSPTPMLDPGLNGLAIGVGFGEQITWVCRAELRYISRLAPALGDFPAPPDHWVVKDDEALLDLAVLQLVALDGSALQTPPEQVLARHGKVARALSLGVPPSVPLIDLAELVTLGYGQSYFGVGAEQTSTTTRGSYAGCYSSNGVGPDSLKSGDWLKVNMNILGGHSGGPILNFIGEVVGWAVLQSAPSGVGQLRPIASLVAALTWVLQQPYCNSPAGVRRDVCTADIR